jgi:orotidine-5'-phosphate decarboxylase
LYGPNASVDQIVDHRAKKALEAGCHGLIASGSSVRRIRGQFGDEPLIVTPGIRPQGSSANDHKRTLTPFEAIRDGANFLVVGRPIRDADDPKGVAEYIVKEIERGQAERDRLMKSHRSHREDFNALLNVAVGGH